MWVSLIGEIIGERILVYAKTQTLEMFGLHCKSTQVSNPNKERNIGR